MVKWIQIKWKPKGHIKPKMSARGFFTVVFSILEEKTWIFENGPYFFNNVGLTWGTRRSVITQIRKSLWKLQFWFDFFLATNFLGSRDLRGNRQFYWNFGENCIHHQARLLHLICKDIHLHEYNASLTWIHRTVIPWWGMKETTRL